MKQTTLGAKLVVLLNLCVLSVTRSTAQAPAKPNIVFIMTDDARYDEFRPSGGADWFIAPNIERIANEGINFNRTYAPTPICGPSRASIYTGVYSHQSGTQNNGDDLSETLPLIQNILIDDGYYTGFIGKYGNGFPSPNQFDYWVDIGDQELYKNLWIKVNGTNVFVSGHLTDAFNTYLNAFMDSAAVHNDKPFALFFFPLAPHTPNVPRATDAAMYNAEVKPFPENFYPYDTLYPTYYTDPGSLWVKDTTATVKFIQDRYSCLYGVDENVSKIMLHLDDTHETDSSIIFFTSDNGYLIGEHMMRAKVMPLEESIRVPLYVRYPAWFPAGQFIDNDLAELIDIPKTILDAIGIPDTFGFMGKSLRDLAEPDTLRPYAFYEYEGTEPDDVHHVPDIRGVRSFDYLYTTTNCDCWTEEFYDLTTDPLQDTNQVANPKYHEKILEYRAILAQLRLEKFDTLPFESGDCGLYGSYEIPDDIDNDCDGIIDNDLDAYIRYQDIDNDGYGDPATSMIVFGELPGYVNNPNDCNDTSASIHPAAIEICDGIDNDCDGFIDDADPDVVGMTTWYFDNDFDGLGNDTVQIVSCFAPIGYISVGGDCNDNNPAYTIGGPEICNGIDDDCDGLFDDADPDITGQTIWYADNDGDGLGNDTITIIACGAPEGYVITFGDCNDSNADFTIGSPEICNAYDDDCDGLVDDADPDITGQTIWYADIDNDGYSDWANTSLNCFAPEHYVAIFGDCNDADSLQTHGTPEVCNLLDDDCDGLTDDEDPDVTGKILFYADMDSDGYGNITMTTLNCFLPIGYVTNGLDCNDLHSGIHPLASEICDGIDNNCNLLVDDADPLITGRPTWYLDADFDTYGSALISVEACNQPVGYVDNNSDCNDLNGLVHPGVADYCDLINNDCDAFLDEDPVNPVITASGPVEFCKGSSVTFTASPIISGFNRQWYKGTSPIAGATGITYTATQSGSYKVKYTAPAGCITYSAITTVTVNNNPKPVVSLTSASNDLCVNNPVKLSCKNKIGSTFQWYKGAVPLFGEVTNKYNATTSGNYKVKQIDPTGCFGTSSAYSVVQTCHEASPYQDEADASFVIYPNPSQGDFTLQIDFGADINGEASVKIYSMLGQMMYEAFIIVDNGEIDDQLNVSGQIPSGVYLIEATIDQQKLVREIVIE